MVHNPNAHIPHQFNSADTAWGRPVPQQQLPPAPQYPGAANYAPQPTGYPYHSQRQIESTHSTTTSVSTQTDKGPKNHNKLVTGIALGAAGVTAAAAALIALGMSSANDTADKIKSLEGDETTASDAQYPGHEGSVDRTPPTLSTADPAEFLSDELFTDQERVAWAWDILEQPTTEPGYEGMSRIEAANKKLVNENPLADRYTKPSTTMTGDQILSNEVSIYYFATNTNELSHDDRAKVLAAAIDNSNPVYDSVLEKVLTGDTHDIRAISEVDISSVNKLPVESPVFKNTVLENGFNPGGIETKVMNVHLKNTDFENSKQKYYQFIDGKPIQLKQLDSTEESAKSFNPQDIPAI